MRLALLPAAVLIGDPSQQWLATAVPIVLQQDLATSSVFSATLAPDSSAAYQLEANNLLRSVFEQRNGKFRIEATMTAMDTQRTTEVFVQEGSTQAGVIPLLDAFARKLDPARASPFSTRKDEALRLFAAAFNAPEVAARAQLLDASVQADPAFGLAEIARVQNTSSTPDSVASQMTGFVPLDRARWEALLARFHHAPSKDQADAEAAVVQLAPNNIEALAHLGSLRFLQGNSADGEQLLRRAITINPTNINLSVELAQGLVAAGQFTEASTILIHLAGNNPNLLPSVALIQLMNGNITGANETFKRFLSFLPPGNPALPALESQWQRFTSRRTPALPAGSMESWRSAVDQSGDTNLFARAMLAVSLEHAGRLQEAQAIHLQPFIPEFGDPNGPVALNEVRRRLQRK